MNKETINKETVDNETLNNEALNNENKQTEADSNAADNQTDEATAEAEEQDPLETANKQIEELKDKYLRTMAEFDNYRKRTL